MYSRRSPSSTSALFPMETIAERPTLPTVACPIMAKPKAPLWVMMPRLPEGITLPAKVEFNDTSAVKMPKTLGPKMRIPFSWAASIIFLSSSILPISEKPEVITMAYFTPLVAHSFTDSRTNFAGIVIQAVSISSGTSSMLLYALMPAISPPLGLIGKILFL